MTMLRRARTRDSFVVLLLLFLNLTSFLYRRNCEKTRLLADMKMSAASVTDHSEKSTNGFSFIQDRTNATQSSFWIGDLWIPPKKDRFFSAREIQDYFANESILFVGDSLSRRVFNTLFYILNTTTDGRQQDIVQNQIHDASVIDVNKNELSAREPCNKQHMTICRKMPKQHQHPIDFAFLMCDHLVEHMLKKIDLSQYTMIFLLFGTWHQSDKCPTNVDDPFYANQTLDYVRTLDRNNLTIVFRTLSNPKFTKEYGKTALNRLDAAKRGNRFYMDLIQNHQRQYLNQTGFLSSLTYLDWAKQVHPRSYPNADRIMGDIPPHFGFEPKLVFLQMLMNHLVERDRMKEGLLLHPLSTVLQ